MPQCLVNRLSIFTHEFYPQIDSIILSVILLCFYITLFLLICFILLYFIVLSVSSILPILFPSNKVTHFIRLPNRLYFSFQFSYFVLPMIFLLSYPVRIWCLLTQQRTAVQKNGENGQHPQRFWHSRYDIFQRNPIMLKNPLCTFMIKRT